MRAIRFAPAAAVVAWTLAALAQPPAGGEKYALLVGVQFYADAGGGLNDLKYCENDVTRLAAVLKNAGYRRVVVLTRSSLRESGDFSLQPTAANVRRHLAAILKTTRPGDSVVVAFAGHGVEPKGANGLHFCAEDSKLADPKSMIPLEDVYTALKGCKATTKVLVADACRNDPLNEVARSVPVANLPSLTRPAQVLPPGGVIGLFSCSAGEKAFESKKLEHGYLFHALIEGFGGAAKDADGNVNLLELATYVVNKVPDRVKDEHGALAEQIPELIGQVRGKVTLVKAAATASRERERPERPKVAAVPPATGKTMTVDLGRGVSMEFVRIEAGEFRMGAPGDETDAQDDEKPQHRVTIAKPFWLAKYETTQEQYEAVVGVNPSKFASVPGQNTKRFPVERVSWNDATQFCDKLTESNGRHKFELPTEAQWEYACRAGTETPFHFGRVLNGSQANHDGNYPYGTATKGKFLERTCTVGSYSPNAWGLYDMHGNVWEWCRDAYDAAWYKNTSKYVDPFNEKGDARVLRGGSWSLFGRICRAASRYRLAPSGAYGDVGFRVLCRLD